MENVGLFGNNSAVQLLLVENQQARQRCRTAAKITKCTIIAAAGITCGELEFFDCCYGMNVGRCPGASSYLDRK